MNFRLPLIFLFVLPLSCFAHRSAVHLASEEVQHQRVIRSSEAKAEAVSIRAHTLSNSTEKVECFGLCTGLAIFGGTQLAAALGGAQVANVFAGLFIAKVSIGITAGVIGTGIAVKAMVDELDSIGLTNETLSALVVQSAKLSAKYSELSDAPDTERAHRAAVLKIPWTSPEYLRYIETSCGEELKVKGLGASASSSRSGALFWKCKAPDPSSPGNYPPLLLKGGIRATNDSPEWQLLNQIRSTLSNHLAGASILNKPLLGFTSHGDIHWAVMEDVSSKNVFLTLKQRFGALARDLPDVEWNSYDIKPVGSRSPQRAPCFKDLRELAEEMGPIQDFSGWDNLAAMLQRDLVFLDSNSVIDQSLFIQVSRPFDIEEISKNEWWQRIVSTGTLKNVLSREGTPKCAYQVKGKRMAIVCVSILDYYLSLTTMKQVQNAFQYYRWDNYGTKMKELFGCLGSSSANSTESSDVCQNYAEEGHDAWLANWKKEYAEASKKNETFASSMKKLQEKYRCCCNLDHAWSSIKQDTACTWVPYKNISWWVGCPGSTYTVKPSQGGCAELEPSEDLDLSETPKEPQPSPDE